MPVAGWFVAVRASSQRVPDTQLLSVFVSCVSSNVGGPSRSVRRASRSLPGHLPLYTGFDLEKGTTSFKNLLSCSAGKQARYRCAFCAVVVFLSSINLATRGMSCQARVPSCSSGRGSAGSCSSRRSTEIHVTLGAALFIVPAFRSYFVQPFMSALIASRLALLWALPEGVRHAHGLDIVNGVTG